MELAYIGMGANIASPAGPPERTLAAALVELGRFARIVCRSSLYSTEPVGYADQPRFVNAVVGMETGLTAQELLRELLRVERVFGRDRSASVRNGPRPLDLDLLLFGEQRIEEAGLHLPHPRLQERAFVLTPLNEIAPEQVVVTQGRTVKELLQALRTGQCDENDAILPLYFDFWRPCACDGSSVRAEQPDPHRHG